MDDEANPSVRAIFDQALAIESSEQRLAYLVDACAGDPKLRGEVETLLGAYAAAGTFLESPAVAAAGDVVVGLDPPTLLLPAGTVIGRYKLLEPIGEGGYGTVFMAEQTSPVHRKVALKIIKAGMDTRQVIARFEAERQALALMDHPNIAKVFDAGTTDTGRPYFVMELVKGIPITKYCDAHHIEPRQRLELFMRVCQAVQHAHQKGIIHRDLKPNNVLVAQYDGKPVPKVIDFGVAKATGQQLTDMTMFTGFGDVIGTLEYMSPEQAEVNQLDVDTRSDIYSLGVLLYELLTGSTPLENKRVRAAGLLEMLRVVREEEPPRPSMRLSASEQLPSISANRGLEPRKLSGLVKGELDWIVMKALEKDRGRRYETANGFAADVQNYLDDEAVQACPPSATYRLRKIVRRNKGSLLVVMALAALLVLGTVGTSIGLVRARRAERSATAAAAAEARQRQDAETQRDKAVAAEKHALAEKARADEEAATATAVSDFLRNDLIIQASPVRNAREKKVTVEELLGRAAAGISGKFGQQPHIEAAIRRTIGLTYYRLGDYPAAEQHLQRAWNLERRVRGEEHHDTLVCMNNLAALYKAQGRWLECESLYIKTIEVWRRVGGEEDPHTLSSMSGLAAAYQDQGRFAEAEPLSVKMLDVRRRVQGEEHPDTLSSMSALASLYLNLHDFAKAEPLFVKTVELSRRVSGEEHPSTLDYLGRLAAVYSAQGEFAKAEPLHVRTVEAKRRVLGEEHSDTLTSMHHLAALYTAQGRFAEAEPLYVKTREVQRRVLGEEHRLALNCMRGLARLYQAQGEYQRSEQLYIEALEVSRRVLGEDHRDTLISMNMLASLYDAQGKLQKAEPIYREALEKMRKRSGQSSFLTAYVLVNLGDNLLKQHKYADAEPLLRECLSIDEQKQSDDWRAFEARSLLGGSLLGQKKYADAEPLLLAGYAGTCEREEKIPVPERDRVTEALERLVQFYDATAQPKQAAGWREKLEVRTETEWKGRKAEEN